MANDTCVDVWVFGPVYDPLKDHGKKDFINMFLNSQIVK